MVPAPRSVLITLLGCAVFGAILLLNQHRPPSIKSNQVRIPMPDTAVQNITFKGRDIFDGTMEEGSRISDAVYESSDGVKVIPSVIFFNSPARAKRELQINIDDAVQVVERDRKSSTSQVEERSVITYAPEAQAEQRVAVVWTNGSELHSIKAPTLLHALELEKHFSAKPLLSSLK